MADHLLAAGMHEIPSKLDVRQLSIPVGPRTTQVQAACQRESQTADHCVIAASWHPAIGLSQQLWACANAIRLAEPWRQAASRLLLAVIASWSLGHTLVICINMSCDC